MKLRISFYLLLLHFTVLVFAQSDTRLTIDRIFASSEFQMERQPSISWIEGGDSYVIVEDGRLIKFETTSQERSVFLSQDQLTPDGRDVLNIEDFSLSDDESKVLIFTNSKRVWRTNSKGDYWVYDFDMNKLSQLGSEFPSSSLMFAKFSADNQFVSYVMEFNLYVEDFVSGEVTQLTEDGTGEIINGTFDWVYEEEFGCRDGFRWNPGGQKIAYWQLDASKIGNFNIINNTDSIYSQVTPIQYPKVGQDPSSAKVGIVDISTGKTNWIQLEGSTVQNYIPAIQWVDENRLIIQQLNRKQNHLKAWIYNLSNNDLKLVYEEKEDTWVDIKYPDPSFSNWGNNDFVIVDGGKAFLRMTEDDWRNVYKINISTGQKTLITPGTYDVASFAGKSDKNLFYIASPGNSTQRYLYSVGLDGKKKDKRITPGDFPGINTYNIAPNGKYALHYFRNALTPMTVNLVSLPDHKTIKTLVSNDTYKQKISKLDMPTVEFSKVTTEDGIEIDVRIIKPSDFDPTRKYPVIFYVYGEPWGQVANDNFIGLWNVLLTHQDFVVVNIDNRGTPCLKGSEWRKSIYRNIGRINIRDLAQGAREVLKLDYLDEDRAAVWGWSGGGSSTLGLMFQYPDVFQTGVAVAFISNQLTYDNIYQERYMGLPQENEEDFLAGSAITHAKNLEGNLLLIHGTADDNVHYQNMELLVNELIKQNKQFDMMSYPNRTHGIYEGENTSRHLYTKILDYMVKNVKGE